MRHLLGYSHKSGGIAVQSQILLEVFGWLAVEIRLGGALQARGAKNGG